MSLRFYPGFRCVRDTLTLYNLGDSIQLLRSFFMGTPPHYESQILTEMKGTLHFMMHSTPLAHQDLREIGCLHYTEGHTLTLFKWTWTFLKVHPLVVQMNSASKIIIFTNYKRLNIKYAIICITDQVNQSEMYHLHTGFKEHTIKKRELPIFNIYSFSNCCTICTLNTIISIIYHHSTNSYTRYYCSCHSASGYCCCFVLIFVLYSIKVHAR